MLITDHSSVSENAAWQIIRDGYDAADETNLETVFTLSNGYMGVRGALEVPSANKCQGTYITGVYDKPEKDTAEEVCGLTLKNKAITPAYAIMPDLNLIEIRESDGNYDFMNCEIEACKRILDMKHGVVYNTYVLSNAAKKRLQIRTALLVSETRKHILLQELEITALNFSATLSVCFKNTLCENPQFIPRLKDYISRTELLRVNAGEKAVTLDARITETNGLIFAAAHTVGDGHKSIEYLQNGIAESFRVKIAAGQSRHYQKIAVIYTSRDGERLESRALDELARSVSDTDSIVQEHFCYWKKHWRTADVEMDGDIELQQGIRWNIFNLIQLGNEQDDDISISATGLHGQGYFGHVFWDTEIFMLPFYLATDVTVAKNLLLYRYHRLDEARKLAAEKGFSGAKYPWTSTATGADVTPPDWERCANRQIHISGDIAYAFYNYYLQTGDWTFLSDYGIEVIVETAKFYVSRAEKSVDGLYHFLNVIGPDEYNIHADDNYYTNHLAAWNIQKAVELMDLVGKRAPEDYKRLSERTNWSDALRESLMEVVAHMAYPQTRDGVNEQYQGFFAQRDIVPIKRDSFNMPENKTYSYADGTQVLKQADVVMMHYLFPDDFSKEVKKQSYAYYEQRCLHGSSLSPSIHCITGLRNGYGKYAYGYLYLTALLDLKNLHLDKNLFEGLHTACAGGTWAAAVYGFGGVSFENDHLNLNPILPKEIKSLKYSVQYKGTLFDVTVAENSFTVTSDREATAVIGDQLVELPDGEAQTFRIDHSRYIMN